MSVHYLKHFPSNVVDFNFVVPILPELLRNSGNDLDIKGYYGQHFPTASYKNSNGSSSGLGSNYSTNGTSMAMPLRAGDEEHDERSGVLARDCLRRLLHLHMLHENSQLGLLFSTKVIY